MSNESIKKEDLLGLHKHYESINRSELDFFFRYLNFYTGLLSAIVAATITGMLSLKHSRYSLFEYTLLSGPVLIIFLSCFGYQILKVYYRRSLEAWVTVFNIQTMLHYNERATLEEGMASPIFINKHNSSFIVQFYRKNVGMIFDRGKKESWTAEDILKKLLKGGDTLRYARYTFAIFCIVSIALAIFIILDLYS